MARLPHRVALTRHAVIGLERPHETTLFEREVLARLEWHYPARNHLTVQVAGRVEQCLDSWRDAMRHHVDSFTHAQQRAARGMHGDRSDMIQMAVAQQRQTLIDGCTRAAAEIQQ